MRPRLVRRRLARLAIGLFALLLAAAGTMAWLLVGSLPQLAGETTVPGLSHPVRIVRDAHAVPHVEARTVEDAYLAMGFLHGQDRLWQMEFHRRLGQGRLAEILGAAALPADRFMRLLGLARRAEAAASRLRPETLALLDAYAQGVNAAIKAFGRRLPPEFLLLRHRPEPWRPADSLLFQKLMALDLSTNWRDELLRARLARRLPPERLAELWPELPPDAPTTLAGLRARLAGLPLDRLAAVLPPAAAEGIGAPAGIGSNVWVVDGSRTLSGRPLLANDPHLPLQAPGPWYLAHLEAPGLGVIGATLPALPFVVLGRNRDVAWGFTNTGSDTQDLFVERLDPDDPGRYQIPEGFRPFVVRQETIGVRGGAPVALTVRETRHGPVVSDLVPGAADAAGAGHVLALAWTQLRDEDPTVEAGFAIATSRDAAGFVAAVAAYQGAQQNMAFADRYGRIGMASPGLVPIRRRGDGRLPQPGWSGEFDWLGTIPSDALPRRLDPAGGLLFNANNRLVGAGYPYLLARDWDPDLRARRLAALLAPARDLDVAAFAAVQLDLVSTLALDFLPHLLAVAPKTPDEREILAALAAWDRRMPAERPEPLVFAAWYRALAAAVYADELGPLFSAYRGLRPDFMRHVFQAAPHWCDDIATAAVETCRERAGLAFRTALRGLQAAYGPDWRRWRWGAAHPAVMAHRPLDESGLLRALFTIARPVGGDGSTINVALAGAAGGDALFPVVHAPTYRAIHDLSSPDGEGSRHVAATGQSGHPLSPHYRDLSALWQSGHYLPMSMRPATFARGAIGTLKLLPAAAETRG